MCPSCRSRTVFEWLIRALVCAGPVFLGVRAWGGECGERSPDYTAMRLVIIGDHVMNSKVYVSTTKIREEDSVDGRKIVVLRLAERGVRLIYDPQRKEGVRVPIPPPPNIPKPAMRSVIDKLPNGMVVRHLQTQNGSEWKEFSTTTCRPDQVMTEQTFTVIDPHGKPLAGRLSQTNIVVGPLPKELFEVPKDITMRVP